MKKHLKSLLLVGALTMAGAANAQSQSAVRGKVVDAETGEPLIGATITVNNIKAVTDVDGAFSVKGIGGAKNLTVQYIG